ncbi:DUF6155 family protein [Paenibacillus eucommiae]|uniref:Uncharacterized protein n=1 Tax=Paenibacillus eucommiae TaxID=1355755 RepID=A0ABS4J831_9BACL|nr:DUF6155 family protein [Paenibacillus eucommiae]MBP1996004.1 hypothetical protein [Paenibacillus eucommiae]
MEQKSKITASQVKKTLKGYDSDVLISIIMDCYKMNDGVKKYLNVMIDPEGTINELYEGAKDQVLQEFFPKRGEPKLRLAKAKKAIAEFSKLSHDEVRTIDLMIYYVELGVKFIDSYGWDDEHFYNSMASVYANIIKNVHVNSNPGLAMMFKERMLKIVTASIDMDWELYDDLINLYSNSDFYEEEDFE